jgi:hypothetical protein
MKNIFESFYERIHNFQFSDTFEMDEDESYQIEEQVIDDDFLINHGNFEVGTDNLPN